MQPTARADELRQPLRAALAALEQAVALVSPLIRPRRRRLAGGGDGLYGLGDPPADAGWVTRASPGSRLAVFELQPARLEQQAASDTVDIFFHTREGAPGLHQRLLFRANATCWLAGWEHPALRLGLARKRSVSWSK